MTMLQLDTDKIVAQFHGMLMVSPMGPAVSFPLEFYVEGDFRRIFSGQDDLSRTVCARPSIFDR